MASSPPPSPPVEEREKARTVHGRNADPSNVEAFQESWRMSQTFRNPPPNPVRGCLFVGERNPNDNFLFVFRRRGAGCFNPPDNSGPNRRFSTFPQFAPPKNKKEEIQIGG